MPQLGPWGSILIRAKPTGSSLQSYSSEREWIVKDFKPLLARPSHYFFFAVLLLQTEDLGVDPARAKPIGSFL